MREQVEVLEHHADLAADLVDALEVVGELDAVDDDSALLVFLQPVDAADHGRLAGTRRPANHHALAAADRQVDVAQHVEIAVPLVHADHLDRHLVLELGGFQAGGLEGSFGHRVVPLVQRLWPVASLRSIHWEYWDMPQQNAK